MPTVRLAGVDLHAVSEQQAVETILAELECGRGGTVVTPNLDHLHRCKRDLTFRALVTEADLVVPDGMPLVWASRLQGTPLPERVAGSNLIITLSEAAAAAGRRVFLLGGEPGTAEGAAEQLKRQFPDLIIAGTHCPERGFEYDTARMAHIVQALQEGQPDIVFVALGSPKQEKLVNQVRHTLPSAWWLGVGISFSFLTGHVRRAPPWMQRAGIEWVHRLLQEPRRLFKRYVLVGIPFAGRMMLTSVFRRFMKPVPELKIRRAVAPPAATGDRPLDAMSRVASSVNTHAVEAAVPATQAGPGSGPVMRQRNAVHRSTEGPQPSEAHEAVELPHVLSRLRALVLLAGRVRPNAFTSGTGRPILELPLGERDGLSERLIDGWLRWGEEVAQFGSLEWLPVRVVVSDEGDEPLRNAPPGVVNRPAGALDIHHDLSEYRGTGGLLHDLAGDYGDDDLILVCNAQQVLIDPLSAVVRALATRLTRGADVALVAHDDGTPSGGMLIRCRALRQISTVGYVDMKEQALPKIAREHGVRVVRARRPTGLPVRTAEGYIQALQRYHALLTGRGRGSEPHPLGIPLAENYSKHFALVEPGAEVHPTAYLHDSVVLDGARIEAGTSVVRSIVCPGGVVKRDERVVDATVTQFVH